VLLGGLNILFFLQQQDHENRYQNLTLDETMFEIKHIAFIQFASCIFILTLLAYSVFYSIIVTFSEPL